MTLGSNLTRAGGVGTENTTLTLNGGTLDMGGFSIGTSTNKIGTGGALTLQTGTLKNLAELNGGTTVVTKSTAGTWILAGTNAYTGGTTLSAGTLQIGTGSTQVGSGRSR